jgi:hypothetical protein
VELALIGGDNLRPVLDRDVELLVSFIPGTIYLMLNTLIYYGSM